MGREGLYLHIEGGRAVTAVSNRGICLQGNDPGHTSSGTHSFFIHIQRYMYQNISRFSANEIKKKTKSVYIEQKLLEEGKS